MDVPISPSPRGCVCPDLLFPRASVMHWSALNPCWHLAEGFILEQSGLPTVCAGSQPQVGQVGRIRNDLKEQEECCPVLLLCPALGQQFPFVQQDPKWL